MIYTFDRGTEGKLSNLLGKRPDKTVDAEYLRKNPYHNKWMFWSEEDGKYISPLKWGAQIEVREGLPPRLVSN